MHRQPRNLGARLEALLDERDHLRIKINLAEDQGISSDVVVELRRRLLLLDKQIMDRWSTPEA
jgi:hypothetical protein